MDPSLEQSMNGLMKVFQSHARKEGDKYKLNKAELKLLLEEQMGDSIAASKDPSVVDEFMLQLDQDRDGEVDFKEFAYTVVSLTVACHESL
ncbi:protein S100-A1-like [Cheilinus undulatus]|uniref:protein S100-A1-like n=1 Tax=Cheilinus undulatus TaxID=241271 RepID=UPI001BD436D8|nr:protein S100-A1-like [Cheilinus undulatus]XP_041648493.1 protein S100-A1-like [Cheilinus undulatus]